LQLRLRLTSHKYMQKRITRQPLGFLL
jgi:hypothetical protein